MRTRILLGLLFLASVLLTACGTSITVAFETPKPDDHPGISISFETPIPDMGKSCSEGLSLGEIYGFRGKNGEDIIMVDEQGNRLLAPDNVTGKYVGMSDFGNIQIKTGGKVFTLLNATCQW